MWRNHAIPHERHRQGPVSAYGRALGSLLLGLTVTFWLLRTAVPKAIEDLVRKSQSAEDMEVVVRYKFNVPVDAPLAHQYADFLLTRLTYEPILAVVVGAGLLTAIGAVRTR